MVGVNGTEGEVTASRRSLAKPAISPLIISPNGLLRCRPPVPLASRPPHSRTHGRLCQ